MSRPIIFAAMVLIASIVLQINSIACADQAAVAAAEKLYDTTVSGAMKIHDDAVAKANADMEARVKAADKEFEAKRKLAARPLIARLKLEAETAARKGDDVAALRFQDQIKALENGAPVVGGAAAGGGGRMQGTLFAIGGDSLVFYINSKLVCQSSINDGKVAITPVEVGIGDVLSIKAQTGPGSYEHGVLCTIIFEKERKQITTSVATWKCYTPSDPGKWYDIKGVTEFAAPGTGGWSNPDGAQIMRTVITSDADTMWAPKTAGVCYFALKVTPETLRDLTAFPAKPAK